MQTSPTPMPRPSHAPRGDNRKLFKLDRDTARRAANARRRGWLNQ